MQPQFYYTSEALEDYMKIAIRKRWDTAEVGAKIEAFAVAGSNILSKLVLPQYRYILTASVLLRHDAHLQGEG